MRSARDRHGGPRPDPRGRRRRTSRRPRARAPTRPPPRRRRRAPRRPGRRALDERLRRLAGLEVDGGERLHQRRQRLHRRADDDLLAVRDARLDPAGAVRLAPQAGLAADDLVVRLRAAQPGEREAVADLDALHGLDAHQRGGEPRVEPILLRRVRAEAGRDTPGAHLDDAAERLTLGARRVDRLAPLVVSLRAADLEHRSGHLDADLAHAAPSPPHRRRRRPRCGARWPARARCGRRRGRTSSHPARSAWPGRGSVTAFVPLPAGSPSGGHGFIPHVQFLWSRFRTTSASGVPSVRPWRRPGEHLDLVGLDLLARAAAVALLAPAQVCVDRVPVEDEACGEGPVRIATSAGPCDSPRRSETERHRPSLRGRSAGREELDRVPGRILHQHLRPTRAEHSSGLTPAAWRRRPESST